MTFIQGLILIFCALRTSSRSAAGARPHPATRPRADIVQHAAFLRFLLLLIGCMNGASLSGSLESVARG